MSRERTCKTRWSRWVTLKLKPHSASCSDISCATTTLSNQLVLLLESTFTPMLQDITCTPQWGSKGSVMPSCNRPN